MRSTIVLLAQLVSSVVAQIQYTSTASAAVEKARATALTLSPTSHVQGKTFDRFVTIWLENTDFDMAASDPSLKALASQGITLTNYNAITHPSQGNYISAVGGSLHGVTGDSFVRIPSSEKTIVDLLDAKRVSWGEYQEDLPYSGFQGNYVNQKNGKNDYVRKHNPLISYDSVTEDVNRLAKIKNFTMFERDLANNALPQWMFITPNMTNDGHDTSVTTAGKFTRNFITPLLNNLNFMQRTLVLITFDEREIYIPPNKVFSILLGDAVPENKKGTKDDTVYDHYSQMATVEKNWDLGDLGKEDHGAKAFF